YFLSAFGTNTTLTGFQTVVVVQGLTYGLDTGANVGGSNFYFAVDGSGNINVSSPSATGVGATLRLNNTTIRVDPLGYTGRYYLSSHAPNFFTGLQSIVEVPGLVYYVDDGSFVAGSDFFFTVDAAGQITNIIEPATNFGSISATGSGSTLTLLNAVVSVDPGT